MPTVEVRDAAGCPGETAVSAPAVVSLRFTGSSPTSKLVASGLCRLLSGFPLFSEAIQVAYSNPERTLSRKRPPRCPSSKPSSMGGRSRKNDIIDHPASLTLPPGGFTAAIANSKPTPGRVGIQDFGPSALIHRSVSRTSSHCRTPLVPPSR